jgi:hypothetical protein
MNDEYYKEKSNSVTHKFKAGGWPGKEDLKREEKRERNKGK